MLEERRNRPPDGRSGKRAQESLLAGLEDALLMEYRPATRVRHCPCCARPIRAGQPITTIHGTSVHVRCGPPCASTEPGL
jgi:hypothetical protein